MKNEYEVPELEVVLCRGDVVCDSKDPDTDIPAGNESADDRAF